MAKVTATLQVSFSEDSDSDSSENLALEIDDRDDGLNGGDTDFRPGDNVHYLMYLTGATLTQHFATAGSISSQGSGARAVSGDDAEYLTFTEAKEGSLSYPASGGLSSWEWIGNVFDANGDVISDPTPTIVDDGHTVRLAEKVTGILKVEYNAPYDAYRLSGVSLDLDRALIYAQAETT